LGVPEKEQKVVVERHRVRPLVPDVGQVPYGNGAVIGGLANVENMVSCKKC